MKLTWKNNDDSAMLTIDGKIDSMTATELETFIKEHLGAEKNLLLDLEKLDYTSSAGIRIFLSLHKKLSAVGGKLTMKNIKPNVMEVFNITGMSDIFNLI